MERVGLSENAGIQAADVPLAATAILVRDMTLQQTVPLLLAADLRASADFYCRQLGFEVVRQWEPDGALAWCWLQQGGAALMLQQACDEDPPPAAWGKGMTLYFLCDAVDAFHRELTERNVTASTPEDAFYGMRQMFVTDPDGYALCFETPTAAWR